MCDFSRNDSPEEPAVNQSLNRIKAVSFWVRAASMTMIHQVPCGTKWYHDVSWCLMIYSMIMYDISWIRKWQNWGECSMKVDSRHVNLSSAGPWSSLWSAKTGCFRGDGFGKTTVSFLMNMTSFSGSNLVSRSWAFHDDCRWFPCDVHCRNRKIWLHFSNMQLHVAVHSLSLFGIFQDLWCKKIFPSMNTMGYPSPGSPASRHRW